MFVFFRQSVPDGQSLSPRSFFYPRTITTITAISDERGYFPKKMKYTLVTMVVIAVSTLSNSFHKLSAASGWMVGETRLTQLGWKPLQYWFDCQKVQQWLLLEIHLLCFTCSSLGCTADDDVVYGYNSVWFDWKCTEWPQDGEHNLLTHFAKQT